MEGISAAALSSCLCLRNTLYFYRYRAKETMLRTYLQVLNFLFQAKTTNDFIAEADASLTQITQSLTVPPTQNAKASEAKSNRSGELYDEYIFRKNHNRDLHESVNLSIRSHWDAHLEAALYVRLVTQLHFKRLERERTLGPTSRSTIVKIRKTAAVSEDITLARLILLGSEVFSWKVLQS